MTQQEWEELSKLTLRQFLFYLNQQINSKKINAFQYAALLDKYRREQEKVNKNLIIPKEGSYAQGTDDPQSTDH